MKKSKLLLVSASLLITAAVLAQSKGIYGEDNRKDVYETTNPSYLELAKSTAAMIENEKLTLKKPLFKDKYYLIESPTLQSALGLCRSERFSQQISAANCSAFLISPTKLVTAGHCIATSADCKKVKWVFDYKIDSAEQKEMKVPPESIYKCSRVISHVLDKNTKIDYAVVELDRPVVDRTPLKFRQSGKVEVGDELVVIGHPSGLPTKIADGAKVRSTEANYFVANLDSYGGNSGSAVFNVKTEEVEGILVRGDKDYQLTRDGSCFISTRCKDDECRGESSTYITIVPGLKGMN